MGPSVRTGIKRALAAMKLVKAMNALASYSTLHHLLSRTVKFRLISTHGGTFRIGVSTPGWDPIGLLRRIINGWLLVRLLRLIRKGWAGRSKFDLVHLVLLSWVDVSIGCITVISVIRFGTSRIPVLLVRLLLLLGWSGRVEWCWLSAEGVLAGMVWIISILLIAI